MKRWKGWKRCAPGNITLISGDMKVNFGDGGEVLSIIKGRVGYSTDGAVYSAKLMYAVYYLIL